MSAVRAKATIGFISEKQATTGRRLKPWARRSGATTSSALQIVGVSHAVRAWRLAALGKSGIGLLRPKETGASLYWHRGRAASHFPGLSRDTALPHHRGSFARGSAMSYTVGHFELAGFIATEDWQQEFNRRFADAPAK